jgi:hypothetical protein
MTIMLPQPKLGSVPVGTRVGRGAIFVGTSVSR